MRLDDLALLVATAAAVYALVVFSRSGPAPGGLQYAQRGSVTGPGSSPSGLTTALDPAAGDWWA